MRGVIRVGDSTDHGCQVQTGSERSVVMGRAVARIGDRCTCQSGLGECEILEGDEHVRIDGRAANLRRSQDVMWGRSDFVDANIRSNLGNQLPP